MRVKLYAGDVFDVAADGVVVQVDGAICVLGSASSRALKRSLDPADRDEEFADLEDAVKRLRPLPHGEARLVDGAGKWPQLVVVAAVPHHTHERHYSVAEFAAILERSIYHAVQVSGGAGLASLVMTTIGSTYRLPAAAAVEAMARGLARARREPLAVTWCFVDPEQQTLAEAACRRLGVIP